MKDDLLLPGWRERIESARGAGPALPLPPPLGRTISPVAYILSRTAAGPALVQAAYESPVTCIGIDTEYRFDRDHPIRLRGDYEWYDIRSVRPFCLAFAIIRGPSDAPVRGGSPPPRPPADGPGGAGPSRPVRGPSRPVGTLRSVVARPPRAPHPVGHDGGREAPRLGRCPLRARARRAEDDAEAARLKRVAAAEEAESLALERGQRPAMGSRSPSRRQGDPPGLVPDQASRWP